MTRVENLSEPKVLNVLSVQVFAEKMGLETGWNCHISLTPNGDSPCEGAVHSSPSQASLHHDMHHGNHSPTFTFTVYLISQTSTKPCHFNRLFKYITLNCGVTPGRNCPHLTHYCILTLLFIYLFIAWA